MQSLRRLVRFTAATTVLLAWTAAGSFAQVELPFSIGEVAHYKVSYGILGKVGAASLEILGPDTIRGITTYHLRYALKGGIPGARIDDTLDSWFDPATKSSVRFVQRIREVRFSRDRVREFLPGERRWSGHTNNKPETGELEVSAPLDDISFLFFVRSLDLKVGDEFELDRYWDHEEIRSGSRFCAVSR